MQVLRTPILWVIGIACGGLCAYIATAKHRNIGLATIIGLLTGVIGVIVYPGLRTVQPVVVAPNTTRITPMGGHAPVGPTPEQTAWYS